MADYEIQPLVADGELFRRSGSAIDGIAIADLGPPWADYTPQIDQGATTNIAKTITRARFRTSGDTIDVSLNMTLTAAGTAGQLVEVSLPATAAFSNSTPVGSGYIYDASAPEFHPGIVCMVSTTRVVFMTTTAGNGFLGVVEFTTALASGDFIRCGFSYEAA